MNRDSILDWIEDHRKLLIFLIIVLIIVAIMFAIRHHNLSNKAEESNDTQQVEQTEQKVDSETSESADDSKTEEEHSYVSSIKNKSKDKKKKKKVESSDSGDSIEELKPNYNTECKVFGHTSVPNKNVDGSSCKDYLSSVTLADFGTNWGTSLDVNDMKTTTKYLVGVDKDDIDEDVSDLKSVGWLINNVGSLGQHDIIKFTNLHIIGSLSDSHVAVLCSYDWYSAFGLKDTLVMFEDISGTLSTSDFSEGSIFSAIAFVHNMKVVSVNGQNVVCVQYNVFK